MHKLDTCYYHRGCSDGISAAWCIRQKYPDIEYIGINPSDDDVDPESYNDKVVIFVDVCPTKKVLEDMLIKAKYIIILDHHKTNEAFISGYIHEKLSVIFDMTKSGCQIAWDYVNSAKDRPWFIDYVGDRDLWKFELPDSKFVNVGLYELGHMRFEKLDELYEGLDKKDDIIKDLVNFGKLQNDFNQKIISNATRKASKAQFKVGDETYTVWLGTIISSLKSEFGNVLANTFFENGELPDFAVIYDYDFSANKWWMSLRSISTDVSEICNTFGGGGHKFAAGFQLHGNNSLREVFDYMVDE